MQKQNIAVLLTCHNRRSKTISCLSSLFEASIPLEYQLDVYLTDDGSTDGTGEKIKEMFPSVNVLKGNGNLFWAGGMRLAWKTAMQEKPYDAYVLINDDVELSPQFFSNLLLAEAFSLSTTGKKGIYSGATIDATDGKVSYGGSKIMGNKMRVKMKMLSPTNSPQKCEITNANVLWISKDVVDSIGIFDHRFTHGIADYDYSLMAYEQNIPVFLAPGVCGVCPDDHGKSWRDNRYSLKERIAFLKSPKGLAYNEYMYYIKKHFPLFMPYSFIMLWGKTLFPFLWERFKAN